METNYIIREHYFTDGRKLAGGVRGRRCFVDYLLYKETYEFDLDTGKGGYIEFYPTKSLNCRFSI
jgi:type I restriction enzyme R subunit